MHHYANGRFDWLISANQSVNPSREAISLRSGKYKRVTFVHPVVSIGPIKGVLSNSGSHSRAVISDNQIITGWLFPATCLLRPYPVTALE